MNDNPLAGHPLLQPRQPLPYQVDIEAKPVIAEAMADAMAKPTVVSPLLVTPQVLADIKEMARKDDIALVGADFGAVEARAIAAHEAGMLDDHGVPYGANRGGDAFPKDEPRAKFVVPHNISEADLKEVIDRLHKETKLPFEVVRAAVPAVAKEAPAILRSHQEWMREEHTRQESRLAGQIIEALAIIKKATRPIKPGFIEHELGGPIFRALEPELNRHPNVKRKTHKNQIYYTWKA